MIFMIVALAFIFITETAQTIMNSSIQPNEAWFYHAMVAVLWLTMLCDRIKVDDDDEEYDEEDDD